jgi:LysM repeat protein
MGFFDRFRKSFDDEVTEALDRMRGMGLGISDLTASIDGKVVTLRGKARDMAAKSKVMQVFNELVETDNTVNLVELEEPPAKPEKAPAATEPTAAEGDLLEVYEVVSGDTLGAIAKRYYGDAGKYPTIFEANRDILDDPNLIKVGQKLKIPRI